MWVLTNADGSKEPDTLIWGVALGEEGLGRVDREGEGHNSLRARSHDHALDPETDEGHERAKCHHDVRVVSPGFLDHAAQLGVAVGAY